MYAVRIPDQRLVVVLMRAGAQGTHPHAGGPSAVSLALEAGQPGVAKLILTLAKTSGHALVRDLKVRTPDAVSHIMGSMNRFVACF